MYTRRRFAFTVLLLAPVSLDAHATSAVSQLTSHKTEIATALSEPVYSCVSRIDTEHTAFRGCIDWHSAAHGLWALSAYTRATGDTKYVSLIDSLINEKNISLEKDYLRRHENYEMPYGRAWFLRLAIEHNKLTNLNTLKPMADELLASLMKRYDNVAPRPLSISYSNDSWALINMYDYAFYYDHRSLVDEILDMVPANFVNADIECDYGIEIGRFMAVCTNWAWLVGKVLPTDEYMEWSTKFFALNGAPDPVLEPISAHHFGLNFSRAWGLWEVYCRTGEERFASLFARHFKASYTSPDHWRGSYRKVGHWVAQFGMFALQPLFGDRLGGSSVQRCGS